MIRPRTVVVVGAGGNIGSHLVPHLARLPLIDRLVLIDRDRYEERNATNQAIDRRAIGQWKAEVQARVARRVAVNIDVVPIPADVEHVPLGVLQGAVILTCLDSRRSRQYVNEAAWRLGVPWIDAGVMADGSLVRLTTFVPRLDTPCLECGFSDADYAALEQCYPCGIAVAAPTGAPAELGALVASLQGFECRKLLTRGLEGLTSGEEIVIDCAHHRQYVTMLRRNPACLFDHRTWPVAPVDVEPWVVTFRDAFALGPGDPASRRLRFAGSPVARRLTCSECGAPREVVQLVTRLRADALRCRGCGGRLVATGHGMVDSLSLADLEERELDRSLSSAGVLANDIIAVSTDGDERYYELVAGCAPPPLPEGVTG